MDYKRSNRSFWERLTGSSFGTKKFSKSDSQTSYRSRDPSPARSTITDSYRKRDPSPFRSSVSDTSTSYRTRDPSPFRGSAVNSSSSYTYRTRDPSPFRSTSTDSSTSYRKRDPSPFSGPASDTFYRKRDPSPFSGPASDTSYRKRDPSPFSGPASDTSYRKRDPSPFRSSVSETSYRKRDPSPFRSSVSDTSYRKRDPSPYSSPASDTSYRKRDPSPYSSPASDTSYRKRDPSPYSSPASDTSYRKRDPSPYSSPASDTSYRKRDPSPYSSPASDTSYRKRDPSPYSSPASDTSYRKRDPSPYSSPASDTSYRKRDPSPYSSPASDTSYRKRDPSPYSSPASDTSYRKRDPSPYSSSASETSRKRDPSPFSSSASDTSYRKRDPSPFSSPTSDTHTKRDPSPFSSPASASSDRKRDPSPFRGAENTSSSYRYRTRGPSPLRSTSTDTLTLYRRTDPSPHLESISERRRDSKGQSLVQRLAAKYDKTSSPDEKPTSPTRRTAQDKPSKAGSRGSSEDRVSKDKGAPDQETKSEAPADTKQRTLSPEPKDTGRVARRLSLESDQTGIRAKYARALAKGSTDTNYQRVFTGSGGRTDQSSSYRPLIYTPGSPSPQRRSWSGYHSDKMSGFMSIGRNSVFPDVLSRTGSAHSTSAYPESSSSSDLNFDSVRYKTLRLLGNSNNVNNNGTARPFTATGTTTQTSKNNTSSARSTTSTNGNGSRNIYRQPASATASRIRNQTADLRRKYFSQRLMWFSEADEKPREESPEGASERRRHSVDSTPATPAKTDTSVGKDVKQQKKPKCVSILKRSSLDLDDKALDGDSRYGRKDRSGSPSSNRGRGRSASVSTTDSQQLKARFKDDVAVIYYDQEEKTTAVRGTESVQKQEKLKDDKSSSSLVTEGSIRIRCSLHPGEPCSQGNVPSSSALTPERSDKNRNKKTDEQKITDNDRKGPLGPCIDVEGNLLLKTVFKNKTIDMVVDDQDQVQLKLVVPIGADFIRNRTSVKATSGGKRLIVIAYRCQGEGEQAHVHQYVEKMTVPHPIDAYSVRATMDKEGNLKITAPMLIYEQNNVITRIASER